MAILAELNQGNEPDKPKKVLHEITGYLEIMLYKPILRALAKL